MNIVPLRLILALIAVVGGAASHVGAQSSTGDTISSSSKAPRKTPPSPGSDSSRQAGTRLRAIKITTRFAPRTVTFLPERHGAELLTGKKTEVLLVDSVGANAAQNVARQVLARLPGLVVAETEGSGFPSNGVAVRGLNPTQSVEMNVRQNGVNIAADPYGYNETYYVPPLEAVERVELVRGASGLQYGPQFGGMINYVMKQGDPSRPLSGEIQQTTGSYGLANTYASVGGGRGQWRWFGYAQRRVQDGWRPNSDMRQTSAYGSVAYAPTSSLTATLDYSLLRNRIHMPGGLSDAQWEAGARQSYRARNWLTSPWNIGSLTLDWRLPHGVRLQSVTSVLGSSRALVWRNEDGGPGALDLVDPVTGRFVAREVGREGFRNVTEELRVLAPYRALGLVNTLSAGARWFSGSMRRQGGGEGSSGADDHFSLAGGAYGYDLRFGQSAASVWIENAVRVSDRLSVTPGVRVEQLRSRIEGYTDTSFAAQARDRRIPLLGVGATWITSRSTSAYANVTQAYRSLDYSALTPIGGVSRIDPHLRDARGVNADLGLHGTLADDRVRFDVGVFRLSYNARVGLVSRADSAGVAYTERTNVANSVHRGLEAYVEVTPLAAGAGGGALQGALTFFNSFSFIDARYTTGEFRQNRVEYAPRVVERAGVTISHRSVASTVLLSFVGMAFGDANNTRRSDDAVVGRVPAYSVIDWSASVGMGRSLRLQLGVNNLADRHYFTRRTDEYPGPGIIPAIGRSAYVSVRVRP